MHPDEGVLLHFLIPYIIVFYFVGFLIWGYHVLCYVGLRIIFLTYHRVKCQNQFSSWKKMKGDIPQGSAFGPLLFLVYMNTLPSIITAGTLLQYADDTTLICGGSAAATMNNQLQLIHYLLLNSKMKLKSCAV